MIISHLNTGVQSGGSHITGTDSFDLFDRTKFCLGQKLVEIGCKIKRFIRTY